MSLKQRVDWLIPEKSKKDTKTLSNSRILVYTLISIATISFVLGFVNQLTGMDSDFPLFEFASIVVGLIFLYKYTGSTVLIGNIVAAVLFIMGVQLSLKTGGLYSNDVFSMFYTALFALLIANWKSALFWSAGIVGFAAYLYVILNSEEQIAFFREQTMGFDRDYYFVFIVLNIVVVLVFFYIFKKNNEDLVTQLEESKEILERQSEALNQTTSKLERSNTELAHYAHVTSHDLKQPVRTILGFSNLLERNLKKEDNLDDVSKEYLSHISHGSKQMSQLIEELLSYSQFDGDEQLAFQTVNLEVLLDNVLGMLNGQISKQDVALSRGELPTIKGVEVQLTQLFQNLISNSIKYQEVGAQIKLDIRCEEESKHWHFTIRDNGIGIPAEEIENVFDPFKKLHNASEYEGSGLGLSTCRKIIDLHKGQIWAESEMGKGTTIHFSLPK